MFNQMRDADMHAGHDAGPGFSHGVALAAGRDASELEQIRRANALAEARRMRNAIAMVMVLLKEIDDIETGEPDLSAFAEIAGLFGDVAEFAARGAGFARMLAEPGAADGTGRAQ
ncbi:hypothetical protein [Oricola thermophila]|uniref:Uncharacterized protein n=1 Tax=Oricola thermophila TaxID=2742145 RepID=A0A6N1VD59_9HYPH|nr:hypothetical protein [Oricola thermophila]QKV18648.1 hypothetical protein HTY61_09415 [Oricola thermophila]